MIDGNDIHLYPLGASSVMLLDMKKAAGRGEFVFDPRLLLVCPAPAINSTLRESINYAKEYGYDNGVVIKETLNGTQVWLVCFYKRIR
ncbi:MAG: hypothetical protein LBU65_11105 [Planctomycetaceae bacterium]|nr:hypothetical protein [Planctomycetaceae bacterium]